MEMVLRLIEGYSVELLTLIMTLLCAVVPVPFILKRLIDKYKILIHEEKDLAESKIDLIENKLEEWEKEQTVKFDVEEIKKFFSDFNTIQTVHERVCYKNPSLEELYKKRNTDNFLKKVSFILAVIMSIIGTIILFIGIIVSLFSSKNIGWVTTSSGAIIEVVAGIYFWLLNRTMKEVKDNSRQLEKTENLLTAMDLVEKITDTNEKDNVYKSMIDNLICIK